MIMQQSVPRGNFLATSLVGLILAGFCLTRLGNTEDARLAACRYQPWQWSLSCFDGRLILRTIGG